MSDQHIIFDSVIEFLDVLVDINQVCILKTAEYSQTESSYIDIDAINSNNDINVSSAGYLTYQGNFSFYFDPIAVDLSEFKANANAFLYLSSFINKTGFQATYLKIYSAYVDIES